MFHRLLNTFASNSPPSCLVFPIPLESPPPRNTDLYILPGLLRNYMTICRTKVGFCAAAFLRSQVSAQLQADGGGQRNCCHFMENLDKQKIQKKYDFGDDTSFYQLKMEFLPVRINFVFYEQFQDAKTGYSVILLAKLWPSCFSRPMRRPNSCFHNLDSFIKRCIP